MGRGKSVRDDLTAGCDVVEAGPVPDAFALREQYLKSGQNQAGAGKRVQDAESRMQNAEGGGVFLSAGEFLDSFGDANAKAGPDDWLCEAEDGRDGRGKAKRATKRPIRQAQGRLRDEATKGRQATSSQNTATKRRSDEATKGRQATNNPQRATNNTRGTSNTEHPTSNIEPAPGAEARYDIADELGKAWDRIVDRLRKEPEELWRRLARRRLPMMNRPPRPWCLCIRAADTRINSFSARCAPSDAAYPRSHLGPKVKFQPQAHDVIVDKPLLRTVCMPVHLDRCKSEVQEVTDLLGRNYSNIRRMVRRGLFAVRRVPGLGGRHGHPIPLISVPWPLDPSAHNLQPPDPLWAHHWPTMVSHVPDDFEQILTRVPRFSSSGRRFQGWDWLCPGCGKTANQLYYPVAASQMVLLQVSGVERDEADGLPSYSPTFACKSCHGMWVPSRMEPTSSWGKYVACVSGGLLYGREVPRPPDYHLAPQHLMIDPSAIDPGRLAPRISARKHKFVRHRRPAPKSEAIIPLFLQGLGLQAMARQLGITPAAVSGRIAKLLLRYRRKRRKTLFALLRRMYPSWARGGPAEFKWVRVQRPRKRLEVLRMLLAGRPLAKIASTLRTSDAAVRQHVLKLYKEYGANTPQELAAKLADGGTGDPQWHYRQTT